MEKKEKATTVIPMYGPYMGCVLSCERKNHGICNTIRGMNTGWIYDVIKDATNVIRYWGYFKNNSDVLEKHTEGLEDMMYDTWDTFYILLRGAGQQTDETRCLSWLLLKLADGLKEKCYTLLFILCMLEVSMIMD